VLDCGLPTMSKKGMLIVLMLGDVYILMFVENSAQRKRLPFKHLSHTSRVMPSPCISSRQRMSASYLSAPGTYVLLQNLA
jgi:hypothetical protein